jgi:hypothetical protein
MVFPQGLWLARNGAEASRIAVERQSKRAPASGRFHLPRSDTPGRSDRGVDHLASPAHMKKLTKFSRACVSRLLTRAGAHEYLCKQFYRLLDEIGRKKSDKNIDIWQYLTR